MLSWRRERVTQIQEVIHLLFPVLEALPGYATVAEEEGGAVSDTEGCGDPTLSQV